MEKNLPTVDNDFVVQCISDYDQVFLHGSQEEVADARLRQASLKAV